MVSSGMVTKAAPPPTTAALTPCMTISDAWLSPAGTVPTRNAPKPRYNPCGPSRRRIVAAASGGNVTCRCLENNNRVDHDRDAGEERGAEKEKPQLENNRRMLKHRGGGDDRMSEAEGAAACVCVC